MDAAERLFAAHGFEATSLRAITGEADVNLGAVNYHFATKDDLIVAVLTRRMRPINDRRLALLGALEAEAGRRPLTVEQILEAMFRPVLELLTGASCTGGRSFLKLIGHVLDEPGDYLAPLIKEEFAEKLKRFHTALGRSLPGLPPEEIYWKQHFAMGAFVHTVARARVLELMSGGTCKMSEIEETLARVIAFCAAGFKAHANAGAPVKRTAATNKNASKTIQPLLK